ncbi:NPC intracellular cholesterol transporter 2-like [Littorina saxatilis]|uniref:MD-2-related lipid-recognition domain-containing protein n=1 Tax=Littorina saxatilis TaxID=31220 RepID=A0AAN9BBT1_9CAEN
MWKVVAVVVAACIVGVFGDKVQYKDCGSVSGTISDVDITPCPTEPCQFVRTKTINVTVDFTAKTAISTAVTKVYGFILGIKTPFPVPGDACQDMTCPIASGAVTSYKNSVFVKPEYPKVSVVVQWEVHDQDDKLIICFNVPVQISD